jgi:starch binding protein with CBM20 domain
MASIERMLGGTRAVLFAGFLVGCSGGVGGLLAVPPIQADASMPGADSLPAPVVDASRAGIDAPLNDAPLAEVPSELPSAVSVAVADGGPLVEADVEAAVDDGGVFEAEPADSSEASRASCLVTFTVAEAWIDGVVYQDVAVGGDVAVLGAWSPQAAVGMTQVASGTWTAGVMLTDGEEVEFRFVKRGNGVDSWEDWAPNSNRSLVVECAAASGLGSGVDAGVGDAGGTGEAGGAGPVVGVSYAGNFDVQPPDAT